MPNKQNMMICMQSMVGQGFDERQKPVLDINKTLATLGFAKVVMI